VDRFFVPLCFGAITAVIAFTMWIGDTSTPVPKKMVSEALANATCKIDNAVPAGTCKIDCELDEALAQQHQKKRITVTGRTCFKLKSRLHAASADAQ